MGQPRQDELISFVGEDAEWLRIDLSPPRDEVQDTNDGAG